jgi:hypothetical protein
MDCRWHQNRPPLTFGEPDHEPRDVAVGDVLNWLHAAKSGKESLVDHNGHFLPPTTKGRNLSLQLRH